MDVVLEVFDTFLFDRLYAAALPTSAPHQGASIVKDATTTFSSVREHPTALARTNQLFQLEPSQYAYMSQWPRDNIWRQGLSLYLITWYAIFILYNWIYRLTLAQAFRRCGLLPLRLPILRLRVRPCNFHTPKIPQEPSPSRDQADPHLPSHHVHLHGASLPRRSPCYAKLYDSPSDAPFALYNLIQFPFFICFTDFLIYWIHRGLHHPLIYKTLHKPHHKWIMPTPYASHAFHPLDGFAQSVPYHMFPYLFPLQKFAYILLFVFINIWTVFIRKKTPIGIN